MADRILIIEDDIDISELIRDYFEINGFDVTIVHNGIDGYETALKGKFDLIILDIMLPGMDGFEICRKLRDTISIPILIVSAKRSDIDIIRGLGIGADDYISKPFSPNELVARAVANLKRYRALLCEGSQKKGNNIVENSELRVDFDSRRVYRNGTEVALTNKEFELLEFFLRNPNKVFSRETLFNRIWDENSFGDISTVTVHIKRLREKIAPFPQKKQYIETVWGAGYRFSWDEKE